MTIPAIVVAAVLAAAVTGSGVATLTRQPMIVETIAAVGFPLRLLWLLGALKLLAAAGLCAGILLWPPLALAAAAGLVGYFAAAVWFHLRAGRRDLLAPGLYLAVSVAAAVLIA
ncbi:DoxX family protein [Nocardia sp. NPDC057353]|uniref:DoxX family protein n=1 Tax=Nocardia sp. NPDC057353 TaxID=3346104 RepID=UPI00362B8D0C